MGTFLKIGLSLLSGVLVCLSFPSMFFGCKLPEMGWLGFVALVPLITVIRKEGARNAFLFTFTAAIVWYSGSLYWIFNAMRTYGGLSVAASASILALLVVILSAYIAMAPFLARMIGMRVRGEMLIMLPALWTAVELCRNYLPCGGFPWANIALSQWSFIPFIQFADVTGAYGVVFLVVWVNTFIAEAVAMFRGEEVPLIRQKAVVTAVLFAAALVYGFARADSVGRGLTSAEAAKVGLVQGNISQDDKWEDSLKERNLGVYRLNEMKLKEGAADLIVWPEAAFPWTLEDELSAVSPNLLGLTELEFGPLPYTLFGAVSEAKDGLFYNSAFLFNSKGRVLGAHHKTRLVPFGEYVPMKSVMTFARKLTEPVGEFGAGRSFEPLTAGQMRLGPLICFEDIFPEISRKLVKNGANLLVNMTNNAWFGNSSAPFQLFAHSVFRAVEERRFLVRAANTGISGVIAPTGEVVVASELGTRATIAAPVALMNGLTPYAKSGDWFAFACVLYAGVGVLRAIVSKKL